MVEAQRQTFGRRRYWPALVGATLLDLVGMAVSLAMAQSIEPLPKTTEAGAFLLLVAVFGGSARLLAGQARSVDTLLFRQHPGVVLTPLITVVAVAGVQLLSGAFNPLPFLLLFATFWTVWIGLALLSFVRLRGPLRVLLIEPAPCRQWLAWIPGLDLVCLEAPPSTFDDWDLVVIDPSRSYPPQWNAWLSYADMVGVRSVSAPLAIERLARRMPLSLLSGEWPGEVFSPQRSYLQVKRVIDTTLVVLSLPVLLPLMAVLYLTVLTCDGRPVFFWQWRVGMDGKPFRMLKLRTMRAGPAPSIRGVSFTSPDDMRVTKLGKVLRRTRLDELPQLWNVLRGEMSLIGPRPEQAQFVRSFRGQIPMFDQRHNVRPGITGWAQVMQGYAASTDDAREKLCLDLYYVRRCSFWLDLHIAFKTLLTVATGFGSR